MPISLLSLFLAVFWLLSGCSAPHDNPLDPRSDYYVAPVPIIPEPEPIDFETRITSVHISRIFPSTDTYHVVAELFENDSVSLDSAWVTFDTLARVSLSPTNENTWATIFSASYFGDPRLGSVVGKPFNFESHDTENIYYTTGPAFLFRVIETTPVVVEPDSQDIVGPDITLHWQSFSASFPFAFKPKVIREFEGIETTVYEATLPSNQLSAVISNSLEDGDYFWTLTVIDSLGNTSRSKEGVFSVQAGIQ